MEWINKKDRLPEESEDVLVWCKKKLTKGYQAEIYCYEDGIWYSTRSGCFEDNVTHWQPLPKAPN